MTSRPMVSVVIPTFNERENIADVINAVNSALKEGGLDGEVVVIDDDSQDGTADVIRGLMEGSSNVRLFVRKAERGLASAVMRGFGEARGEVICVMDADMSHPPGLLPDLVRPIIDGRTDLVFASRYVKGGGTEGWPLKRRVISKGATLLARLVTPVRDPMSGYFALRRGVIEGVPLDPKGYKIGLEVLARGRYENVVEVPYTFRDRRVGKSKMSGRVIGEYVSHLMGLLLAPRSTFMQFVKFSVVGLIGIVVNLAVLLLLVEKAGLWYMPAAILAFCAAVTSNFVLNKVWTFKDRSTRPGHVVGGYMKFVIVSVAGLCLNLIVLYMLVEFLDLWYLFAQLLAILSASVLNFVGSKALVFNAPGDAVR